MTHPHARARTRAHVVCAALAALLVALALHATPASASTKQIALIQDDINLQQNPTGELATMKALGANTLRVLLYWWTIAPDPNSRTTPKHFNAADPGAYPAANWAQWDAVVEAAQAEGIRVDLDITGAPPDWAQGKGVPSSYDKGRDGWDPNAADYGQFVRAVATRYSGRYTPAGASAPLPKVSLYSLWNEPNFGTNLGPQGVDATSHSAGYLQSPNYYRALIRTGWSALRADAKGATILIGELAGQGVSYPKTRHYPQGLPGDTGIAFPVPWIETLYCLNSHYGALTGRAAAVAGCPTGRARGSFVKDNPALFDASAFSMHPYASTFSPTARSSSVPSQDIVLPVIGRLENELGRVTGAWHHRRSYPIWSTEYGFVTSPPEPQPKASRHYPSPAQAAIDLNEAEYLSSRIPYLATYAQYLLRDPVNQRAEHIGLFSSGLLYADGSPKPGYDAYRMPVWLPRQSLKRGQSAVIWGGARPAAFGYATTHSPQQVAIQLESGGTWTTIETATASSLNGYFTAHYKFTRGGSLRLAYTYPTDELGLPIGLAGATIYSRTVAVSVR